MELSEVKEQSFKIEAMEVICLSMVSRGCCWHASPANTTKGQILRQLKVQEVMLKVPAEIIEDSTWLFAVRIFFFFFTVISYAIFCYNCWCQHFVMICRVQFCRLPSTIKTISKMLNLNLLRRVFVKATCDAFLIHYILWWSLWLTMPSYQAVKDKLSCKKNRQSIS